MSKTSNEWVIEKEDSYRGHKYAVCLNTIKGYRCGYVEILENHPFYEKDFTELYNKVSSIGLSFSGRLKNISGYYIGWDHCHIWDGVDDEAIRKYNPDNARELIEEASFADSEDNKISYLNDVEQECFNLIDELFK